MRNLKKKKRKPETIMLKTIKIKGGAGNSTVMVGEILSNIGRYLPVEKTVIITDKNVWRCHGNNFPPCRVIKIEPGEKTKNLDTVRDIYEKFLEFDVDRSSFIAGIGGGVVCDIAGFAASTILRGLRFGFVSTTLLSQVDASVGGKNGVNLGGYKNIVGLFSQPEFVICDLNLLSTLSQRELLNGFAEIIKHAAIYDAILFRFLEENHEKALALEKDTIARLVYDSVKIKASVVSRDEKEKGERRKLNFGHTFGHAFEKTKGILHGEAVAAGMIVACELSVKKGFLEARELERIKRLIKLYGLPVELPCDRAKVFDAMKKDKKRYDDLLRFVFLSGIGSAVVREIPISELKKG